MMLHRLLSAAIALDQAACAGEISALCAGVPHGHARIIRCLQVLLVSEPYSHTSTLPHLFIHRA
jgi:hypothetical protein